MALAAKHARALAAGFAVACFFSLGARGQVCNVNDDCYTGRWAGSGPWDWTELVGGATGCSSAFDEFAHASLLPVGMHAGKVLLWRYDIDPTTCQATVTTESWLFDPSIPQNLIRINHLPLQSDIFCSSAAWDGIGNLIVVGGVSTSTSGVPRETYRFEPRQLTVVQYSDPGWGPPLPSITSPNCWVKLGGNLNMPRYYPTVLRLNDNPLQGGVCTPASGSMHMVLGGPQSINGGCGQTSQGNEVWALLENGGDAWSCPIISDRMDPSSPNWQGAWTTTQMYDMLPDDPPPAFDLVDSFPRSFQLSNEQVFIAGDVDTSACPPPAGNVPGTSWVIDLPLDPGDEWELRDGPDEDDDRYYGGAVLHHTLAQQDRVLVFGGADAQSPFTVYSSVREFDRMGGGAEDGEWRLKTSMAERRVHCVAVPLPTGEILVLNGSRTVYFANGTVDPVFQPELYDPETFPTDPGSTRLLAASNQRPPVAKGPDASTPRDYHAFAVLLQDGRVFVGGGANSASNSSSYPESAWSGEIFSPPYLFVDNQFAVQPSIDSTPARIDYGSQFTVEVSEVSGSIDKVVALRPAAITHHADVNQRYIELQFTDNGDGTLDVTAPTVELAPKGHYMLFVVDDRTTPHPHRVPSVAKFVKFR